MSNPKKKKYEFTGEVKKEHGIELYRIRSLVSLPNYAAVPGTLGGWIESERNLSHNGSAWVSNEACVYNRARVFGDARVMDNAQVYGNARVSGKAQIRDNGDVSENAAVTDNAVVYGSVLGNADVSGSAIIFDHSCVTDEACVSGFAQTHDYAWVYGNARLDCRAKAVGTIKVRDGVWEKSPTYIQGSVDPIYMASPLEVGYGRVIYTVQEWHNSWRTIVRMYHVEDLWTAEYVKYFNLICDLHGFNAFRIDVNDSTTGNAPIESR